MNVINPYYIARSPQYFHTVNSFITMPQTFTIIALGGLILAILSLYLYFRMEEHEIAKGSNRRPLPGKLFVPILIACTFVGMAITEWQGVCSLSPWGFVIGIVIGAAAELVTYQHSKRKGNAEPA
jgi:purine-cytosine permease-like protein